jgi:hypothetical protein
MKGFFMLHTRSAFQCTQTSRQVMIAGFPDDPYPSQNLAGRHLRSTLMYLYKLKKDGAEIAYA